MKGRCRIRLASTFSLVGIALLCGASRGEAQGSRSGSSAPDAQAVLSRAAERYAALQGFCTEFHQTIDVTLLRQTRESRGELCQTKPNGFEMRWDDPEGDRIVADGSDLWVYFPSTDEGQAFRTPLESSEGRFDLHREFLSDPGERYEATFLRTERIDGRDTYVLRLLPRVPSPYLETTLWIDTGEYLIRRLEILEESESIRTLDLVGMRLNPQIPPERFRFEPPPGVQVITR
jgi:outer membrane lipoprotein carrier protein